MFKPNTPLVLATLAITLASCSDQQPVQPSPRAAAMTSPARQPIVEIVGMSLFSDPPNQRCGSSPEKTPCWSDLEFGRDRATTPPDNGKFKIYVSEKSVPQQTNTWLDVITMDGVIHSIELTTWLPAEQAVPMLVEKYGTENSHQAGDYGSNVVRWVGDRSELIFVPHFFKRNEHKIILRSFDLTRKEREDRESRSSKTF